MSCHVIFYLLSQSYFIFFILQANGHFFNNILKLFSSLFKLNRTSILLKALYLHKTSKKNMKITLRYLLLTIIISLVTIIVASFINGYTDTLKYILKLINKPQLIKEASYLISYKSYCTILTATSFFIILLIICFSKFDLIYNYLKLFGKYCKSCAKQVGKDILNYRLAIVLVLPTIFILYYAFKTSPTYDEVYTYFWFVNKPFYNCMLFYPFPNNHVFYSLCANISNNIPLLSKLFLIRLPAILAFYLSTFFIFSFIKKHYSEKVSLCLVALFSTINIQLIFATQARGYTFVTFFFIICLFTAYNIVYKNNNKYDWVIFTFSSILGLYTIPAFLYPYATINFLILVFKIKDIKKQIFYNIVTCITVLILYAPIMIVSGVQALFSNRFIVSINRIQVLEELPSFYQALIKDLFGVNPIFVTIIAIIIFVTFIFSLFSKNRKLRITFLVFLVAPFFLLIMHSVIPYTRVFIYYSFILAFLVCITWQKYLDKIAIKILISSLILIQITNIINWINELENYEVIRKYIGDSYDPILTDPDKTFYYVSGDLDFMYKIAIRNMEDNLKLEEYLPYASADTIMDYDYILIEKDRDKTVNKNVYMSNEKMNIYKNNPQ